MIYSTRVNGLKVQIQRVTMIGEADKVVFIWSSETSLPLSSKDKAQIESNCKWYISGGGFKNKFYPITEEDKIAIQLPPSNQGRYLSISEALKREF